MWTRGKFFFSRAKSKYDVQMYPITRYLKTQSISWSPRRYEKDNLRETVWQEEERIHRELPPARKTRRAKSYPNTHSIDSMDPIVLKYTNMVNELRNISSQSEKIYETNFGSIRFDNENVPKVHGQFESVDFHPVTTNSQEHGQEFQTHSDTLRTSLGTSAETGQQEQLELGQKGASKTLQQSHSLKIDDESYVHQGLASNNTNYINSDTMDATKIENEGNENIVHMDATSDSSYFDKLAFGDALSRSPLNSNSSECVQGASAREHCYPDTDDRNGSLNYIDEIFFKGSLEVLEDNKRPTIEYSEIREELENSLIQGTTEFKKKTDINKTSLIKDRPTRPSSHSQDNETASKSAFDYVKKIRQEEREKQYGITQESGDGTKKSYKKILSLLSEKNKANTTEHEMLKLMKSSIIYDNFDIVGVYKPYGLSMHGGTNSRYHVLTEYLPDLAKYLNAEELYPVHRLDATTTGVLLLARTPVMADTLKAMFKARQLKKTYWAITKGIPDPLEGVIDIPVAEGLVDGRRRMVLKPNVKGLKSTTSSSKQAVTNFRVIGKRYNTALVELSPMTGVKHQLRVHLGFGLACPILGDHKYSHLRKMAPQALPGDVLDVLKLKQSKVRQLPLFLHCKSVLLPEIINGSNIFIQAKVPAFFNKTLTLLKLNKHGSRVKHEEMMTSLN